MNAVDLGLIWAGIIVLGVAMYVLLDGFDLGLGILFPFAPDERSRDVMMASVAPVWDGNETWLVLGGTALFGAFPAAFAVLLPALYLPLMAFLLALVFRGVAFEFRHRAIQSRVVWTVSFSAGSTVAAFAQGVVLGAFVQGFRVEDGVFAGGLLDWLTPFSLFTGAALVAGYGLLGATWLILKTEGRLQDWAYRMAWRLLLAVLAGLGVVSLWTPLLSDDIAERWFSLPNVLFLWPIPLVTLLDAALLARALKRRRERAPFLHAVGLFLLSFLGLGISLWPYLVPRDMTVAEAASAPAAQGFLLVGVLLLLPLILGYTWYSYHVFRGKVEPDAGYH